NEATALKLVREKTMVPVPQVLDVVENDDDNCLTVESVNGIELTKLKDVCRQEPNHEVVPDSHTKKNSTVCQTTANQNAERFTKESMLPQLKRLKSSQNGLNGVVILPPWVT
ncbi:hypothetical protein BJ878DRAFT_391266, partial [Calycina marina]